MDINSKWALLLNVTEILYDVAELLKGSSPFARAAQRRVRKADRSLADPFHASMFARLGALLSLLRDGHGDVDFASGLIERQIDLLLGTFDTLVSDTWTTNARRTSVAPFPGLTHLLEMHESERGTPEGRRQAGHRLCLYCPSRENRYRLRRDTVSCERALRRAERKSHDLPSILDKIDSCKELPLPSSISRNAEKTANILSQYWDCTCMATSNSDKKAVLAFSGTGGSERDVTSRYVLNFKTCGRSQWGAASLALTVPSDQKEGGHSSSQPPKSKSKATRFADPDLQKDASQVQSNWQDCNDLCSVFHSAEGHQHVRINERALKKSMETSSSSASTPSMLSLQDVLIPDSPHALSTLGAKDRIVLAVILSYMYLHLSGTRWWLAQDIGPYCWFQTAVRLNKFNPRLPFFDLMQGSRQYEEGSDIIPSMEASMNSERPSLPAFGKLLLEIWKGTRIRWDEIGTCMTDCMEDPIGEFWSCAIKACIWDPELKVKGSLRTRGVLQTTYVHKVIKSLQWLLEEICGISVRDAFSEILHEPAALRMYANQNRTKPGKGYQKRRNDLMSDDMSCSKSWKRANTADTRPESFNSDETVLTLRSGAAIASDCQSKTRLTLSDYTVGWISPMRVEYTAARQMLDKEHERLPTAPDTNRYLFGGIKNSFGQTHNVVICTMSNYTGIVRASEVAQAMRQTFKNLRIGLLVGIGGAGGRPNESDIRLGDVVVGWPTDRHGGAIQYDFVKDTQYSTGKAKGATLKSYLSPPPQAWLDAVVAMQTDHELQSNRVSLYLKTVMERLDRLQDLRSKFQRPRDDLLFHADYVHPEGSANCQTCDITHALAVQDRQERLFPDGNDMPKIHYGTIATGGRVEKNAKERDRISDWLEGVKAFEMEAAGVLSPTSGLAFAVVRGISDYSDSHKNDAWHGYAAASAAAVTKEVLSYMEPFAVPNV